jgi:hypothetical protein
MSFITIALVLLSAVIANPVENASANGIVDVFIDITD